MKVSFGVVIPVHNMEVQLSPVVHEVLDVLSELTARFELLIVDDASTDHTSELAHDLAKQYPQIRVVTHQHRLGLIESARRGVRLLEGDHVVLALGRLPVDAAGLRRAWREFSETGRGGWNRQSWGFGKLPLVAAPAHRRSNAFLGKLQQRWQRWGALKRQSSWTRKPSDPVEEAQRADQEQQRSERPDTVWEQRTAALIPLRRTRRALPRPLPIPPPR